VMLAHNGHSACVRIGAAKQDDIHFKAHAWVEYEGRIMIGGPSVSEFSPFPPFEAQRR
jgi:hypothetical protein